ncbi:MAG: diguanylate cyclase [Gammaproteobacteria bacterium]|nr:diguanylate cyclase [Gammaproteobacteria bacterium]
MDLRALHKQLILGLTTRYVLVLVVLAILVTSNLLLLQHQIELSSTDSAVINTSGRQRMLYQRTALLAQQLAITDDQQQRIDLHTSLQRTLTLLEEAHEELMGERDGLAHAADMDDELRNLYFKGENSLDRRYHSYIDLLRDLIDTPHENRAAQRALARQIADRGIEETMLAQLDHAVLLHQRASETKLRNINRQQGWIWLAAAFTLLYSALAVFRPMARRIRDEFKELDNIKHTLELRVLERTQEVQDLAQAMEASGEAILITDRDGIIKYANQACLRLNGYSKAELIGQHTRIFRGDASAAVNYADLWPSIQSGKMWIGDLVNVRKDGSRYNAHLTIAPILREDNSLDGYVGIQSDITFRKQAEQRLQNANQELDRLATEDPLTAIANRRVFDRDLEEEWARARRANTSITLIMIDIDYFKTYNDSFGHQQGDTCLQQVAQALSQVLSRPADRAARYGGEEFAVLLPDTTINGGIEVAETIRQRIKSLELPAADTEVSPYVSVSLGVASMVPQPDQTAMALLQAADQALYKAKKSGRDRVASAEVIDTLSNA